MALIKRYCVKVLDNIENDNEFFNLSVDINRFYDLYAPYNHKINSYRRIN